MQDLVILGAGGLAREVAWLVEEINRAAPTWNLLGYVDKDADRVGAVVGRHTIVCSEVELAHRELAVAIGIGTPAILRKVSGRFAGYPNLSFPNLIHPTVLVDTASLQLGRGNLIAARNTLTVNVRLGSFNVLNLNCTVGHDVVIGDCCVINPGAHLSGGDTIGSECLIGAGATILEGLTIGDRVIVGAGSVVIKNVKGPGTVMGVPARAIPVPA
jgi:sugar O-acyltransferase (sialic acid O-acetyltransferase NeuD family)